MLTIKDLIKKSDRRAKVYKNFRGKADGEISDRMIVCIPDMHLLEKGPTDDFFDNNERNVDRFTEFLDFLVENKGDLEVIQLGDMFELWQARGNTNLVYQAYPNILGLIDKELKPIYVVGNHDIDICKWYEDQGKSYDREWRHFLSHNKEGKIRAIVEHGFQADFFNNQANWSGAIGREVTEIVGFMEYLHPDIDVMLGEAWDGFKRTFTVYNAGLTARKNPGFVEHEHFKYYIDLMEKYNAGETDDNEDPTDLVLAVIAHTHKARLISRPREDRKYYLMDCGSWVNGGREFGAISGKEFAILQWEV